jgi:4-amino-4-deoxy-L-arabinose transferase-like glycosyltransferase
MGEHLQWTDQGTNREKRRKNKLGSALWLVLVAVCATLFWYSYYDSAFLGLVINDAQDYASIARNVALGKGLISQYLSPLGLAHFGVPQPDIWRAPLWPLILAVFQLVFGFIDEASALAGGCCFIAGACLTFLLGRRWFNIPVALAATALYICSGQLASFSISGLTEPLSVSLMLLFFFVLTAAFPGKWWKPLFAGLVGGIFYLARYNALLFLPPALIYLYLTSRQDGSGTRYRNKANSGWRHAAALTAVFLFAFLLATGPWLMRNYRLAGNPFFSLQKYEPAMFTETYPGYSLYRSTEAIDVAGFLLTHPDEIMVKVAEGWQEFSRNCWKPEFTGVALPVLLFFLLSLVLPLDRRFPAQRGVRPLVVACFLLQLAALLPLHYIPRLFIILAPFYMIYAGGAIWFIVTAAVNAFCVFGKARRGRQQVLAGALGVIFLTALALPSIKANCPDFHPELGGPHPCILRKAALNDVGQLMSPDQVVVSDLGHIFAWYGKRYACKLPYSPADLPDLDRLAPIGAVFLSNWITWDSPDADPAWVETYLTNPQNLYGFKLAKVYPDGSLLYISVR